MAKELHEYKVARNDGATSLRIRSDYDCKKRMFRTLAVDRVAGEMGVGKIISLNDEPSKWKKIKATDSLSKVFDFVCKKISFRNESDRKAWADRLLIMAVIGIAINKPVNPRIEPKIRREKITANG